jgi:hypothetical protein
MAEWTWEPDDFAALWFSPANDRFPNPLRFTSRFTSSFTSSFAYRDDFESHRITMRERARSAAACSPSTISQHSWSTRRRRANPAPNRRPSHDVRAELGLADRVSASYSQSAAAPTDDLLRTAGTDFIDRLGDPVAVAGRVEANIDRIRLRQLAVLRVRDEIVDIAGLGGRGSGDSDTELPGPPPRHLSGSAIAERSTLSRLSALCSA